MEEKFKYLLFKAMQLQGTDIHISLKNIGIIQLRSMGVLIELEQLNIKETRKLINYIKYLAKIDLSTSLKPETGAIQYTLDDHLYYLRISYIPGIAYESIVIRILNNHKQLTIDELSHYQEVKDVLTRVITYGSGLFLLSGPTGSGKTTTMHTLLDAIYKQYHKNIITLEDPIEIPCASYTQIEMNELLGINYIDSLKQILRHDPDVIMIGEIRDEKTAALAISCALTGHLVLSTIHSKDCRLAIARLLDLHVSIHDVKEVLIGVTNQRMFFNKELQQRFCLYEILAFDELNKYFANEKYTFKTLKYYIKEAIEDSYLNEGDLSGEYK